MSQLIARINGGAPVTRHADTSLGATLTLDASDRAGWQVPLTKWSIRCSEAEFEPAGWTWDEGQGRWTYTTNAAPPAVTLSERGAYLLWFEPNGAPSATSPVVIDIAYENGNRAIVRGEGFQYDPINGYASKQNQALAAGLVAPGGDTGASGANLRAEPADLVQLLDLSESKPLFVLEEGDNGDVFIGVDATIEPSRGSEAVLLFEANSADSIAVARSFGQFSGEDEPLPIGCEVFDPTLPYLLSVTAIRNDTFVCAGRIPGTRVTDVPAFVSAEIDLGDADQVVITWDRPVYAPSTTGQGLTTPTRTFTSLLSGQNTAIHTYQLNTAIDESDTPSYVVSSGRTLQTLDGIRPATGTHAVTVGGGAPAHNTSLLTSLSAHWRADLGNGGISNGAQLSTWTSQVGGYTATAAGTLRPVLNTSGLNGLATIDFDGVDDFLTTTATIGNVTGAGTNYYACGILRMNAVSAVGGGYNVAHAVFEDDGGWMALNFWNNAGTAQFVAYQADPINKTAAGGAVAPGSNMYFAIRQDPTNGMRLYINGVLVATAATATGTIGSLTALIRFARNVGTAYANIRLHEIAFCSTEVGDSMHTAQMGYYAYLLS